MSLRKDVNTGKKKNLMTILLPVINSQFYVRLISRGRKVTLSVFVSHSMTIFGFCGQFWCGGSRTKMISAKSH